MACLRELLVSTRFRREATALSENKLANAGTSG